MTTTEQLLHVHPVELAFGPNVRADLQPDPAFEASIREHGVLEPITCYQDDDGSLTVYRGNRRAWTAATLVNDPDVDLTWSTVPVRVVPKPAEADRIAVQFTENEHRAAMTTADRAAAVEQLALLGVKPADIARRVAVKRAEVDRYAAVAGSEIARKAAARFELTLDQAAALAEFQDDTDAVKALTVAAKEGQFEHALQRARDDRAENLERQRVAAELRAAGVTVVDERPNYADGAAQLERFGITPEEHAGCPGHVAEVTRHNVWTNGTYEWSMRPRYWCLDPKGNGHKEPRHTGPGGAGGDKTDEAREAEAAERKRVIAGNKAWKAATEVRRRWLRELAQRKTPPRDAEQFIYSSLLRGHYDLGRAFGVDDRHRQFRDVMGLDKAGEGERTWGTDLAEVQTLIAGATLASPKRATLLTAVLVLCAWEGRTGPHTWRHADDEAGRILSQMQRWDYPLSEIEQEIVDTWIGRHTGDDEEAQAREDAEAGGSLAEQEAEAEQLYGAGDHHEGPDW